jgi:hypothetical protein
MVLNITVLATIIFRNILVSKTMTHPAAIMHTRTPGPGIYLKEELNLNTEQYMAFKEARLQYQGKASEINRQILALRNAYFTELMRHEPDPVAIGRKADSIGVMHAKLMTETGNYYQQVRNLCSEDQLGRLNTFFLRVMQGEQNPEMRSRNRHGRMPHTGRNAVDRQ